MEFVIWLGCKSGLCVVPLTAAIGQKAKHRRAIAGSHEVDRGKGDDFPGYWVNSLEAEELGDPLAD
jgi:hypothetical protein